MNIGLTYDLRSDYLKEGFTEEETAEFDRDSTIEELEKSLIRLGHSTDRIGNLRHLVGRLAAGDRWDLVFNICEGMFGIGREAQVPALLDAYQIAYTFSDPLVLSLSLHKAMTKELLRAGGIATPRFYVVQHTDDIGNVDLEYPLFVKPNAEGTGKGIHAASRVENQADLIQICTTLLEQYPSGLLVEEYLPGREFTVGIIGTGKESRVIGIMEIDFQKRDTNNIYSYQTKTDYLEAVSYKAPEPAIADPCKALAIKAWNLLGCRDAGRIDIRMDRHGIPNFIEINPLAGLDKVHSDLPILAYMNGFDFDGIIGAIIESAGKRIMVPGKRVR